MAALPEFQNSLENIPLSYPIFEEHERQFIKFKEKLSIIKDIEYGDKLSKDDITGIIYLDKNEWGQLLRRKWYEQNRYKTATFLGKDFSQLASYLDTVLENITILYDSHAIDLRYVDLNNEICLFINDSIMGLYNLKKTYTECKEMTCRIDSIILTLIDYKDTAKEKIDKILGHNNESIRKLRTLSI